jgi:ABC-2 type transport system ATP-binding protein
VALTELRTADGAGLEEMFLELTADTQRDRRTTPSELEGAVA